ncbi:MAG: SHOCT domain-containing protein [Actinomycetota bacterium]|nr:SHOCT domain-containing protein [Actinomycetota bacterium]
MVTGMGLGGHLLVLTLVAVLVVTVVGSVWSVLRLRAGDADTESVRGALHRLRQRYAASEIDDEEYQRRLAALT